MVVNFRINGIGCWLYNEKFPLRSPTDEGHLLHVWWTCPVIQWFWDVVHKTVIEVYILPVEFSPAQYLLHLSPMPIWLYWRSLAMHMINAARMCIPVHCCSKVAPAIKEWLFRVDRIAKMEELFFLLHSMGSQSLRPFGHTFKQHIPIDDLSWTRG